MDNPDPLIPVAELTQRHEYARRLEEHMQDLWPEFGLRTEHVVTLLLVRLNRLEPGGRLSSEIHQEPEGPVYPDFQPDMELTLDGIAQFCKHCKRIPTWT
jgi:hypothetical protein